MDVELLDGLEELAPDGRDGRRPRLRQRAHRRVAARRTAPRPIDGVDVTPEMLELRAARGVFRRWPRPTSAPSGLPGGAYDLVTTSLVDEHLDDLRPLYAEARRLLRPGGTFVIVGFHPHFIMASGMPTHFDDDAGEPVAIVTHVHQLSDQVAAAHAAGLRLVELRERLVDDGWVALKPKWEALRGHPVAFATVWRASPRPARNSSSANSSPTSQPRFSCPSTSGSVEAHAEARGESIVSVEVHPDVVVDGAVVVRDAARTRDRARRAARALVTPRSVRSPSTAQRAVVRGDGRRDERDLGMLLGVEEVLLEHVVAQHVDRYLDAGGACRAGERRRPRRHRLPRPPRTDPGTSPTGMALHAKADGRMHRIDRPRAGRRQLTGLRRLD